MRMRDINSMFKIDSHSFESYLKYEYYEDGFFYAQDRIFFVLEIIGGIYYYAPASELLMYYSKLKTFLRALPRESDAVVQSLFLPYRDILFKPPKPKTDNDIIKNVYKAIVDKIQRSVKEGYFDSSSTLREVKNFLIISFPIKEKKLIGKIEDAIDRRKERIGTDFFATAKLWKEAVLAALQALSVKFREVQAEEFLYMMFTIMNQDFDPIQVPYHEKVPLNRQILCNLITTDHHEIAYNKKCWAVAYLEDLRGVAPGFLTDLLRLKRPFIVSMTLKQVNPMLLKAELFAKKKSSFSKELQAKIDSEIQVIDFVNPYKASVVLAVLVDDYKEVAIVESELSDFLSEYKWTLYFEEIIAPDLFLSAMPAHYNEKISRNVNVYEDHALCFLNFRSFRQKFSDEGIILVGEDLMPRCISVFDSQAYGTMISGGSGSGKTFFSQYAMLTQLALGERVFAIDPLGNLEPLAALLGGTYYKIGLSQECHGISIFPKISYAELMENRELSAQILDAIIKMISLGAENYHIKASQRALLQKALFYMYERAPEPTLSSFYNVLTAMHGETGDPELKEFAAALSLFLPEGAYGRLISNQDFDLSNPFVVFDLQGVREYAELAQLAIYGILLRVGEMVLRTGGRKNVYIDEAHYLLTESRSVKFISAGIRVWRTFGGALYLITQQLTDLLENREVGEGIFKTINNFFLLGQSPASFQAAQEYIGYNDSELEALYGLKTESGKYSFLSYFSRSMRDGSSAFGRFYLSLPKYLYWTLTTDTEEKQSRKRLCERYMQQGLSYKEAMSKAIKELSGSIS